MSTHTTPPAQEDRAPWPSSLATGSPSTPGNPPAPQLCPSDSNTTLPTITLNTPDSTSPTSPHRWGYRLLPTTQLIEERLSKLQHEFTPRPSNLHTSPPITADSLDDSVIYLGKDGGDGKKQRRKVMGTVVEYPSSPPSRPTRLDYSWSPDSEASLELDTIPEEDHDHAAPEDPAPPTPRPTAIALLPSFSTPPPHPDSGLFPSILQVMDEIPPSNALPTRRWIANKGAENEDLEVLRKRDRAVSLLVARSRERRAFQKTLNRFTHRLQTTETPTPPSPTISSIMATRRKHVLDTWRREEAALPVSKLAKSTSLDWRYSDLEELNALKMQGRREVPQSPPHTPPALPDITQITPPVRPEPEAPRYTAAQKGKWKAVPSTVRVTSPKATPKAKPPSQAEQALFVPSLGAFDTPTDKPTLTMSESPPTDRQIAGLNAYPEKVPRQREDDGMDLDGDAYGNCQTTILTSNADGRATVELRTTDEPISHGLAPAPELQVEVHDERASLYNASTAEESADAIEQRMEDLSLEIMQLDWIEDSGEDSGSSNYMLDLMRLKACRKEYEHLSLQLDRLLYSNTPQETTANNHHGAESARMERESTPPEQMTTEAPPSWWTPAAPVKEIKRKKSFLDFISDGFKAIAESVTTSPDSPTHADEAFPDPPPPPQPAHSTLPTMEEVLAASREHQANVPYVVRKRKSKGEFRARNTFTSPLDENDTVGLGISSKPQVQLNPVRRSRRRMTPPEVYDHKPLPDNIALPDHIPKDRSKLLFNSEESKVPSLVVTPCTPEAVPDTPHMKVDNVRFWSTPSDYADSILKQRSNFVPAACENAIVAPDSPERPGSAGKRGSIRPVPMWAFSLQDDKPMGLKEAVVLKDVSAQKKVTIETNNPFRAGTAMIATRPAPPRPDSCASRTSSKETLPSFEALLESLERSSGTSGNSQAADTHTYPPGLEEAVGEKAGKDEMMNSVEIRDVSHWSV